MSIGGNPPHAEGRLIYSFTQKEKTRGRNESANKQQNVSAKSALYASNVVTRVVSTTKSVSGVERTKRTAIKQVIYKPVLTREANDS